MSSDINETDMEDKMNVERNRDDPELFPNISDGNCSQIKKKKKKKKKRNGNAEIAITVSDAELGSDATKKNGERDLERKRKKILTDNDHTEGTKKRKRNVDTEVSANSSDSHGLKEHVKSKKKKKKKQKEKSSLISNVSNVTEVLQNGKKKEKLHNNSLSLLDDNDNRECSSSISKLKRSHESSTMNDNDNMKRKKSNPEDSFEFNSTSSDELELETSDNFGQESHSTSTSYLDADTPVSETQRKHKKHAKKKRSGSSSISGEDGSQQSRKVSVNSETISNHDFGNEEMSHSGFKYKLVTVEEDDSSTKAKSKKHKKGKRRNVLEEEKEAKFESWDESRILLPEKISQLVHKNKCRMSYQEKLHMNKMGIKFRDGHFTEREDMVLKKNFEEYLKLHPMEEPWKLLFTTQTSNPAKYKKICKETNFYIQLAGRLNRNTNICYLRARCILFPGKIEGKFSQEEDELLQDLYKLHGEQWMKSALEMGRTSQQLFNRWGKLQRRKNGLENNKKSGRWEEGEDERLIQALKDVVGQQENVFSKEILKKISWHDVAKKVKTRDYVACNKHWVCLVSAKNESESPVSWTTEDHDKLIQLVYDLEVEFKDEIDWESLLQHFPSVHSGQFLKRKWWELCRKAPKYNLMTFDELREWMYKFKSK